MRYSITSFLRRWWFSALLLGVLLTIALISGPTRAVLSNYYYYVMLPLISR